MEGDLFAVQVETVGQTFGVVQYLIYGCLEPIFYVTADQITGKKEEKQGGNKGKGGEKEEEFGLEVGSDDLPFSLQIKFDQVSAQYEKKDEEKEKNDNLQSGEEDIGESRGGELLGFTDKELDGKEEDDEEYDYRSDYARPFFLCFFHFLWM
jgi:hypothetical protein